jgi:hypothetical protein
MTNEEALRKLENTEVTELDEGSLEGVSGGSEEASNGNCGCSAGSTYSGTPTNGNCGCGGTEAI